MQEAFAGVVKQYEHRIMADLDLGCYYKLKTFGPEQPVVTGVMDCPIRVMCRCVWFVLPLTRCMWPTR